MTQALLPRHFIKLKARQKKFTVLTAYDAPTATLLEAAGIEAILIGDSLGNVFAGHANTVPVTMNDMIYHCKAVARGCNTPLLIADMPFMSYQVSESQAKTNAARLIQEGAAHALKVEVFSEPDLTYIQAILNCGIPVLAHLGLTPQSVYQLGGYAKQGKDQDSQAMLCKVAQRLADMGCFAVLLECVPDELAKKLQASLTIPVIGIGSGPHCDAQILVTHDLLGMGPKKPPSFVKPYAQLYDPMKAAIEAYKTDTEK
eukprot:COSAG01_NODE_2676_length_7264_cov_6.952128_7_plen_258_part_00